jgi:hypothetical protein
MSLHVEATQQAEDLVRRFGVQVARWFVGQHDGGTSNQRARDRDPLLLSARKIGDPIADAIGEANVAQQALGARA